VGERSGWEGELVDELSIGALEGSDEEMFGLVGSVASTSDGGAFVYDSQAREIRRFGADGSFVGMVGRQGEGPGEHERINNMLVLPDGRLVVNDPRLRRVTWYDADGEYERSVPGMSGLFGGSGTSFAATADGSSVWVRTPVYPPSDITDRREGFVRHGSDGSVDTLLAPDFDVSRFATRVSQPGGGVTAEIRTPFAPDGLWTVGHGGEEYLARSDRYALEVVRPDGSVLRITSDVTAVPVAAAEGEYHRDFALETGRRIDPGWDWSLPAIPGEKPFIKRVYLGDRGRIWLHVSSTGQPVEVEDREGAMVTRWREPVVFDVFEADGTFLGTVRPPSGTNLLSYRGDTVWGVHRDRLGVSYVKRFRVTFPGPHRGG
jgi:hypothetical protein